MVGHGLPRGCLVWIFSPEEIFYPGYTMETMEERKGLENLIVNQILMCECK